MARARPGRCGRAPHRHQHRLAGRAREWTQAPGGAGGIQWPPGLPAWPELILSEEERDFGYTLETAGGIARALPRLAASSPDVFWAVAGDIHAPQFPFAAQDAARFAASGLLAHLWLVPNPPHHPAGDFALAPGGLYRRALFEPPWCDIAPGNPQGQPAPLAPLLRRAIAAGQVSGQLYTGEWADVGTPQRLAALNA